MAPAKRGAKKTRKKNSTQPQRSQDQIEEHSDGIYLVRKITGSASTKPYRCPGCDQLIVKATPHIVAWLEHDVESRRHWHTPCWGAKGRREPKTQRSRSAPRY